MLQDTKRDATTLRLLLELASERDVSLSTVFQGTNLTESDLEHPYSEIELWQEITAIQNFLREDDDPALGILSGMRQHITCYGVLGFAMMSSKDIRQALMISEKFFAISLWICDVQILRENDKVTFVILNHRLPADCGHYLATRGMAALVVWISELLDADVKPCNSTFKIAAPINIDAFSECFGDRLEFGSGHYSISYDGNLLQKPLKLADRWARKRAESELELILNRRRATITNKVRDFFMTDPRLFPTEAETAHELKISTSTLRRRLREENTSFRQLKGEILHELACRMLMTSTMSIDHIAQSLGFSESASFGRAFKKREGNSPGNWRRQKLSPTH